MRDNKTSCKIPLLCGRLSFPTCKLYQPCPTLYVLCLLLDYFSKDDMSVRLSVWYPVRVLGFQQQLKYTRICFERHLLWVATCHLWPDLIVRSYIDVCFIDNLSNMVPSRILGSFYGRDSTWWPPYCLPSSLTGTSCTGSVTPKAYFEYFYDLILHPNHSSMFTLGGKKEMHKVPVSEEAKKWWSPYLSWNLLH